MGIRLKYERLIPVAPGVPAEEILARLLFPGTKWKLMACTKCGAHHTINPAGRVTDRPFTCHKCEQP